MKAEIIPEKVKTLKVANENNKLACDGFIKIDKLPGGEFSEGFYDTVYLVDDGNGRQQYYQLLNVVPIEVQHLRSYHTVPATGKLCWDWSLEYIAANPEGTIYDKVGIYTFIKVEAM